MMNGRLQKISLTRNPFEFKYIQFIKDQNRFKDVGPCVIMASPGMLQSGFSRDLFESWCTNPKNGVVISGYSVEGTLAKEILKEPNEIQSLKGHLLKLNMTVEYISFSAHVDYTQNSEFIDECEPKHLFLVHGEATEMFRLKATISTRNEKLGKEMEVYALKNGDEVSIPIKKINKGIILTEKRKFTALIMQGDDINRIYDGDDIGNKRVDCGLDVIKLVQKQTIPYNMTWNLIMDVLITEFGANINDEEELKLGGISISHDKDNVILRWEANYCDDVLALAIKKLVDEFGSGIKTLMWTHVKGLEEKVGFLKNYFDDVEIKETKIIVNKSIIIKNNKIYGEDGDLKERVIRVYNSINKVNHNH
ncbi:CPSF3 [Hepatospora eriocheir]|uniref:CPSF3 n=1 Tax=Hepatospora eriocheir TaxID=1081669 RepID=A0A1X0QL99_9MICR|nr:CPSF3 [Hepatospora eriocheir]